MTPQVFEEELLPLFRQLIQNRCVNNGDKDSGEEDKSVETLQNYFHRAGLKCEVFRSWPGRGNLLVKHPGLDPSAPSLMFMGHMDVVPATAHDWTYDPFSAQVAEDHIWGRGAVDMLCWTACQAVGFVQALKARPQGYPGDLIFLALADEEASGRYGSQFLTQHHWDKVKCDYMITELGGFFIKDSPESPGFINLGEKGIGWLTLTTRGTPGHGSMPFQSDNALIKAAQAVQRLARWRSPLKRHKIFKAMAQAMAQGIWHRWNLLQGPAPESQLKKIFLRNQGMARFLHTAGTTTLSPNLLRAGDKVNIIPDRAQLQVDIRFLPGETKESLIRLVKSILGSKLAQEFTYEWTDFFPSTLSPENTPLMEATKKLFRQAHPTSHLVPMFIGGVTDGRFWRVKGTTVYGFTLFDQDMTMDAFAQRIHGIDERISLKSLRKGLDYFSQVPMEFWSAAGTKK